MSHQSAKVSELGLSRIASIREAAEKMNDLIIKHIPNCEERRHALARLHESRMWAVQGISIHNEIH